MYAFYDVRYSFRFKKFSAQRVLGLQVMIEFLGTQIEGDREVEEELLEKTGK
jgi:hypothetical protein